MEGNISQGLHTSVVAYVHRLGDINRGLHVFQYKVSQRQVQSIKVFMHLNLLVRMLQPMLDYDMHNHPMHVKTYGVCALVERH